MGEFCMNYNAGDEVISFDVKKVEQNELSRRNVAYQVVKYSHGYMTELNLNHTTESIQCADVGMDIPIQVCIKQDGDDATIYFGDNSFIFSRDEYWDEITHRIFGNGTYGREKCKNI